MKSLEIEAYHGENYIYENLYDLYLINKFISIEEMINESIDNADANASEEMLNIQPDVKSGNITSEMYEENTIGNVATPQPTSISVGNADSGSANESDNVSALAAPASYSTTKGGVAKHKTRKNKKNGPRKSKRRTN